MSDPTATPPTCCRRWPRILLAAVIVILMAVAIVWIWLGSIRSAGLERNAKVLAAHAAAGLGSTAAEFVAAGPAVDPAVQARYKTWDTRLRTGTEPAWATTLRKAWADYDEGKPSTTLEPALVQAKADLDELAAMLAAGNLQISAFGWLKTELPDPDHASWQQMLTLTTPSLLNLRNAANGFACRALTTPDPAPALEDLHRLVTATDRPATMMDAMVAIAVRRVRDRCHLRLEREGRLPAMQRDRWLATAPDDLRMVADAFRGERLLWSLSLNRALLNGTLYDGAGDMSSLAAIDATIPSSGLLFRIANWTHGPGDMATVFDWLAQVETTSRAAQAPKSVPLTDPVFKHGTVVSISLPNLDEAVLTALLAANNRRLHHLASRILASARDVHALPADEAAVATLVGAPTLAAGPGRCRLRYEPLTPTRFRVRIDPDVLPDGWPADPYQSRLKGASNPVNPPPLRPARLLDREGLIEAELPVATPPAP